MKSTLKYIALIAIIIVTLLLACGTIHPVNAGIFGPDEQPVVNADTWVPMDKCWVYKQIECTASQCHDKTDGVIYFITYVNQNGYHKIEQVDIDTWYSISMSGPWGRGFPYMYYQGGR